jgi:uncharacterized membrane protein
MIKFLKSRIVNVRMVLAAILAAAMLHICATLLAPTLTGTTAFERLSPGLPLHRMTILPPVGPDTQVLPFMGADSRYALCRFDTSKGVINIHAVLPDVGWSLALNSPEGDNFFTSVGSAVSRTELDVRLVPSGDRFLGLTREAVGAPRDAEPPITVTAQSGIAVIRAPDKGLAYRAEIERDLKLSSCSLDAPVQYTPTAQIPPKDAE